MNVNVATVSLPDAVAHLHTALAEVRAAALTPCSDDELLDAVRALEADRNMLATVDHAVIAELGQRGLAYGAGCRSTAVFLREVVRIPIAEANARVKAAAAFGPRRTPTGAPLEPIFPATAAALAAGEISPRHAQLIATTIEKLPDEIQAEMDRTVEQTLLDYARQHDPDRLAQLARDLARALDQDGQYNELNYRDRTRGLNVRVHADGSSSIDGQCTAETTEYLRTILDTLTAPKPAADGVPDPRTASQRRHDGLLDALKLLITTDRLPTTAGVTTTILLRMDLDTYATGQGTATTGHGIAIPADVAKRWGGEETRMILALISKTRGIEAYSTIQRCHTEQQRLAMMVRDGGCSFTGCDAPMLWTEAHHMTEWQETQRTCVDDGALLCTPHHAHFERMGWTGTMRNGRPHWIPPKHIDPSQAPRRNTRHDRPG